jgi:ferredoxin-NADP reductase
MQAVISSRLFLPPDFMYLELLPAEAVGFQAGQFFRLTLTNPPETDSRGNSRFFGFVNSPGQNHQVCLLTRTGISSFKKYLATAPMGTPMDIDGISGNMTLPPDSSVPLVLITSGVGIAPFISLLRYVDENTLPYHVTLNYSPPLVFSDWLKKLTWLTITDTPPEPGNNLYYVTGAPQFVTSTIKSLQAAGIPQTGIRFEIFTGYL